MAARAKLFGKWRTRREDNTALRRDLARLAASVEAGGRPRRRPYCQACGLQPRLLRVIEFHAIRPISRGGSVRPCNKLALCSTCHTIADTISQPEPGLDRFTLLARIQEVRRGDCYVSSPGFPVPFNLRDDDELMCKNPYGSGGDDPAEGYQ
jgi:hypothetical protein